MITSGIIVFASLVIMLAWLPASIRSRMLGRPWTIELPVGILAYTLHYGTFTGMMAAAIACILAAAYVRVVRWTIGYTRSGVRVPGRIWQ